MSDSQSTDRETAREPGDVANEIMGWVATGRGVRGTVASILADWKRDLEAALRSQLTEARERCACQEHSVLVQLENLVTDVRRERDAARAALAQAEADRDEARASLVAERGRREAAEATARTVIHEAIRDGDRRSGMPPGSTIGCTDDTPWQSSICDALAEALEAERSTWRKRVDGLREALERIAVSYGAPDNRTHHSQCGHLDCIARRALAADIASL
jgi:hypothetical protein